ncbi:MAG: sigma-54 dependent transcriptional regulator [Desulfobacterales bacterium]
MDETEILFVDDDRAILALVREYLEEGGYRVECVDNGLAALERIRERPFALVFTDIKMPDIDGLELLGAIKALRPETAVVMVTGHGTMESAIQAMKAGSCDYLQKPFKLPVLKEIVERILGGRTQRGGAGGPGSRPVERHRYGRLVGISPRMQEVYAGIERACRGPGPVLIEGESGTGKELAARVIHEQSGPVDRPFVVVACRSSFRALEAEAAAERLTELWAAAGEGTLYLDELCDVSPIAQEALARMLRARPAAGAEPAVRLPARLIAATQKVVREALARGELDAALFPLFGGAVIRMPPLRERREDLCLLVHHFLERFNARGVKPVYTVDPEVLDILHGYSWPGNLIQLENVIERAFALGVEAVIRPEDLPPEIQTAGAVSRIS